MDPKQRTYRSRAAYAQSATLWKVIGGAACGAAVATIAVATCLDDDDRDRRLDELGYVETTGATLPRNAALAPASPPRAATAQAEPSLAAEPEALAAEPAGGVPEEQPMEQQQMMTEGVGPASTYEGEMASGAALAEQAPGEAPPAEGAAPGEQPAAGDPGFAAQVPAEQAPALAPTFAGSNPLSPPMSAGAGPFMTEAPPWAASAMSGPDPNTGAGAFTTEWQVGVPLPPSTTTGAAAPGAQGTQGGQPGVAAGPTGLPIIVSPAGMPIAAAPAGVPGVIGTGTVPVGAPAGGAQPGFGPPAQAGFGPPAGGVQSGFGPSAGAPPATSFSPMGGAWPGMTESGRGWPASTGGGPGVLGGGTFPASPAIGGGSPLAPPPAP